MSNRLLGKAAVVSGGSSGIGAATSRIFIEQGAKVIIADMKEPTDEQLKKVISDNPGSAIFIETNVLYEEDIKRAIEKAVDEWGRLDITVACAGVPGLGSDVDITSDEWDKTMAINARGVLFLTKHAIPEMKKTGGGSIINISSAYGIIGVPGFAAYCASKGAVRLLTKSTALEHVKEGIRANSIHPGVIQTPMLSTLWEETENPEEVKSAVIGQQPSGAAGVPEDIAWGCVYLASDESKFVTGIELCIDGGLTAK
ncbi:MAG: SDR family oxidoreductase [Anaerovoracaceae bacterium]